MKVVKFGGSSLCSSEQIRKVADIIRSDAERRIAVVSAPGKRSSGDTKVTDMLIALHANHTAGLDTEDALSRIIDRFASIVNDLEIDQSLLTQFERTLVHYLETITSKDRLLDALKSCGEDFNAQLVSAYLNQIGVRAEYMSPKEAGILVTDEPSNAQLIESSYDTLNRLKDTDHVLVIPGFYGCSENDDIVTFPRGGSDITGAIVARGVEAELYENFTDVSFIYSAHPGLIDRPHAIREITYREMRELSYAGFGVFHDEALEPVFKKHIPVMIRNTNDPDVEGTKIVSDRAFIPEMPVIGISCDEGFTSITMNKYLMNREIGFTRRLLQILEDHRLSYEHIPSGIDNLSVILRTRQFEGNSKLEEVMADINDKLEPDSMYVEDDLALLVIVGEGMKEHVGIATKTTTALSDNGVNISMINQGASEISMMFAIAIKDAHKALRAIYSNYFKEVKV
ncbi:aspartate kinase [Salinicoccus cyprini]|uniref:Aspartokinase n=1 Tax=Salinicoccus cyprini TaxID=2493691 RepID=A0A558AYJ1_9STAP|nr:aspartate kinase [Salinicoccus cyprini]TVT29336.1 aspartate kinase [Salinicoccus cyprini]